MSINNNGFPRDSGVLYRSTIEAVLKVKDDELRGRFAAAVLQYLVDGEYEDGDDLLDSLMTQPMYTINQSVGRYADAIENGKKGGSSNKYTDEDVYNYRITEGHSVKEAVEHFGYSERTIRNKVANHRKILEATRKSIEAATTAAAAPEKDASPWYF